MLVSPTRHIVDDNASFHQNLTPLPSILFDMGALHITKVVTDLI